MNVPLRHQLRIAAKTLAMTDEGAHVMGGMTKDEARALLQKHAPKNKGGRKR